MCERERVRERERESERERKRGRPLNYTSLHLLYRDVKRFRGTLIFKAHRLFYHSTLGVTVRTQEGQTDTFRGGLDFERIWHI